MLDPLKSLELLMHVEQQLGITSSLEELDIDNFRSIKKIAQFVVQRNGIGANEQGSKVCLTEA